MNNHERAWVPLQLVGTDFTKGPEIATLPRSSNGLAAGNHRLLVGCQGEDPLVDLLVFVPAGGAAG